MAAPGDEIRVGSGTYHEGLVITKSLTLSGGWTITISGQANEPSVVVPPVGRALTVISDPLTPGITPTVVISNFIFSGGDATGLGGAYPPLGGLNAAGISALGAPLNASQNAPQPSALSPAEQEARLAQLRAALSAPGTFPGGQSGLSEALARVDALTAAGGTAAPASGDVQAARADIDCGGGIYVNRAYLHLMQVSVGRSVASKTGMGAGGGICAVNMPEDGLILDRVGVSNNVASEKSFGYGGGLYYQGADAPPVGASGALNPAVGGLHINNFSARLNKASTGGYGYGGGAFIMRAPGATIELAVFDTNNATTGGLVGEGGGLYLRESNTITMTTVGFAANVANTLMYPNDPSTEWIIGEGGGMFVRDVDSLLITSPDNDPNERTMFIGNTGAVRGLGRGGGIAAENVLYFHVEHSDFKGNWGAVYVVGNGELAMGGGVLANAVPGMRVEDSTFDRNIAAVYNLEDFRLSGGALSLSAAPGFAIRGNKFTANAAGASTQGGLSRGGAVAVLGSNVGSLSYNDFTENTADLGFSGGLGGGLHLALVDQVTVRHNTFLHNKAGAGAGIGGALTIEATQAGATATGLTATGAGALNNQLTIIGNLFRGNMAAEAPNGSGGVLGGAIAINSVNGLALGNNVLDSNTAQSGAGMALLGWDVAEKQPSEVFPALISNNTLVNNPGGSGVYMEMWTTPLTLTNNIVVSHTVGMAVKTNPKTGPITAAAGYNLYNENGQDTEVDQDSRLDETHAITAPVLFADRANGNYQLTAPSPARDAADPAGIPPAPPMDFDDADRPYGPRVDIGAYEWRGPLNFLPTIRLNACTYPALSGWALGVHRTGNGATILHTLDGGRTWAEQYMSSTLLDGLSAATAQVAYASGDNNTLLRTGDGGQSWQQAVLPADLPAGSSISRVTAANAQVAWAMAMTGTSSSRVAYILNTTNGITWTVQTTIPTGIGMVSWMDAADVNNVWVAGGYTSSMPGPGASAATVDGGGFIVHSSDGGKTWRMDLQTPSPQVVIGIDAVNSSVAWAAGRYAAYRTLNGGANWVEYKILDGFDLNHISSPDGAHVWATGDAFNVKYADKGLSPALTVADWQSRSPDGMGGKVAYSADFIDATHGWISGGNFGNNPGGVIIYTCNGGQSWERQDWEQLDPIYIVDMVKPGN